MVEVRVWRPGIVRKDRSFFSGAVIGERVLLFILSGVDSCAACDERLRAVFVFSVGEGVLISLCFLL